MTLRDLADDPFAIKHPRCAGTMWVCEDHPLHPQGHDACKGAGAPCDCNRSDPPRHGFDSETTHVQ